MILSRIRNTISGYAITLMAFFIDFISLYFISQIIGDIYNHEVRLNIIYLFIACVISRMFFIPLLKFVALLIFYSHKKNINLVLIKNIFSKKRLNLLSEKEIAQKKEIIINSSELAVVNFDIPLSNIVGEIMLSALVLFFLIYYGFLHEFIEYWYLFLLFGLFFILIIYLSRKFGKNNIVLMKDKISKVDNIFKNLTNLSYSSNLSSVSNYYLEIEKKYNLNSTKFISLNLMNSFFLETIIYTFLFIIITKGVNIDNSSIIENSLISIPFIIRLAPAFTRTMAFVTQLSYGYVAVKNLENYDH